MSVNSTNCPDREVLVDFVTGHLPDNSIQKVETHLAECAACGDTVRALNVDDTMFKLAREAQKFENEDALVVDGLINRFRDLPSSSAHVTTDNAQVSEDAQSRAEEVRQLLDPAQESDEIGRLAHYRILKLLGAGGMGVVYQAEDLQLRRMVAIKILRPSLGLAVRQRFLLEARAAAAIDHDHVITIYHVGEEGSLAYLAMQWLDGETLEARLTRQGKLPAGEVVDIGRQIASGLAAAHAKNLIHRDIKPANIWLETERGRARILDFGLARAVDDNQQLTETAMIAGTPAYMSPEQAQGNEVDKRSDLFSLGCVLYRMSTGELPFQAPNALATLQAIQRDTPIRPLVLDSVVPAPLSDLVMRLLEKAPDQRPLSASAVQETMGNLDTMPADTPQAVQQQMSDNSNSKRRFTRWAIGVAVASLLALFGFANAPTIIRVLTNQGELFIKTEDPDVRVEVRGKDDIRIVDLKTNQSIDLKAGEYRISLVKPPNGVTLSRDRVTLTRGGRQIVEVTRTNGSVPATKHATLETAAGPPADDTRRLVRTIDLKDADAAFVLKSLSSHVPSSVRLSLDERQNRIVASGTEQDMAVIDALLTALFPPTPKDRIVGRWQTDLEKTKAYFEKLGKDGEFKRARLEQVLKEISSGWWIEFRKNHEFVISGGGETPEKGTWEIVEDDADDRSFKVRIIENRNTTPEHLQITFDKDQQAMIIAPKGEPPVYCKRVKAAPADQLPTERDDGASKDQLPTEAPDAAGEADQQPAKLSGPFDIELRIVPNATDSDREPRVDARAYEHLLSAADPGLDADTKPEFAWFEVNPEFDVSLSTIERDGRRYVLLCNTPEHVLTLDPTDQANSIMNAEIDVDERNRASLQLTLGDTAAERMKRLSEANIHNQLAILIGGRFVSAPRIQTVISNQIAITGNFSVEEIQSMLVTPTNMGKIAAGWERLVELSEQTLADVRTRHENGVVALSVLQAAQIDVTEAQIRLAQMLGRKEELRKRFAELVAHHEERLSTIRTQFESGTATAVDVRAAEKALIEVRLRSMRIHGDTGVPVKPNEGVDSPQLD